MNPVLIAAAAVGGMVYLAKRAAQKKTAELKAAVAGEQEGTVVDLGVSALPSNSVPVGDRAPNPTTPGKTFVIPRLLEILSPRDGEEIDRPGFAGKTYPVTVRWTNANAMEWRARLIAEIAEEDDAPRAVDLGEWSIPGGGERTAVISIGFGGGRINIGRTFVRLRLTFGDHPATASYYVD